jgi:hypothetical protein
MNTLAPFEDESDIAVEAADPANAAIELAAHWSGSCCEKCETPLKSESMAVCRRCGWYPTLNRFVEVDNDWESYCDPDEKQAPQPAPSLAQVWLNLLPRWAWIVLGTSTAVVAESIFARLVTMQSDSLRTAWSLTQLVVGALAFLGCHILSFMFAISDDADTGAFDFIVRPLKLWFKAFRKLPERLWLTNTAAAGLTAVAMSMLVIGGLPYERLWDWGFKQPPKQNLMNAVMEQAKKFEGSGDKDMEEAINDFAGQAGVDDKKADKKPTPPKPRMKTDCVILGYRVGTGGKLQSLVLGTAHRDKLVYACSVSPQLTDEESSGLLQMLSDSQSPQAYVSTTTDAQWVVPKFSCRVSYERQEDTGRLVNAQWDEYLGNIR